MLNAIALFMEGSSSGAGGTIMMVVMLVLMVAVFYFVGIRPQKKQEKQNNEMRNALTVGDEVTTIGGIIGILKSAISRVDVKAEDAAD